MNNNIENSLCLKSFDDRIKVLENNVSKALDLIEKTLSKIAVNKSENTPFLKKDVPMTREEITESVMEDFDFQKVHKVMEFLDWKWFLNETDNEFSVEIAVPTVEQLTDSVRKSFDSAWKALEKGIFDNNFRETWVSAGGFEIHVTEELDSSNGSIYGASLKFVLEEFSSFDD